MPADREYESYMEIEGSSCVQQKKMRAVLELLFQFVEMAAEGSDQFEIVENSFYELRPAGDYPPSGVTVKCGGDDDESCVECKDVLNNKVDCN